MASKVQQRNCQAEKEKRVQPKRFGRDCHYSSATDVSRPAWHSFSGSVSAFFSGWSECGAVRLHDCGVVQARVHVGCRTAVVDGATGIANDDNRKLELPGIEG